MPTHRGNTLRIPKKQRKKRGKPLSDNAEVGDTEIAGTENQRKKQRIVIMGDSAVFTGIIGAYNVVGIYL